MLSGQAGQCYWGEKGGGKGLSIKCSISFSFNFFQFLPWSTFWWFHQQVKLTKDKAEADNPMDRWCNDLQYNVHVLTQPSWITLSSALQWRQPLFNSYHHYDHNGHWQGGGGWRSCRWRPERLHQGSPKSARLCSWSSLYLDCYQYDHCNLIIVDMIIKTISRCSVSSLKVLFPGCKCSGHYSYNYFNYEKDGLNGTP